jgi:hypothetical protein
MTPSCTRAHVALTAPDSSQALALTPALTLHSRPPGRVTASVGVYKTPAALTHSAAAFDPSSMVRCRDYHAHQTSHRRDGAGWTCDRCSEVMP